MIGMAPKRYLGYEDIAAMIDVKPATVRYYRAKGYLPEPDVMAGDTPGWDRKTIARWARTRPGRGARTDLGRR